MKGSRIELDDSRTQNQVGGAIRAIHRHFQLLGVDQVFFFKVNGQAVPPKVLGVQFVFACYAGHRARFYCLDDMKLQQRMCYGCVT